MFELNSISIRVALDAATNAIDKISSVSKERCTYYN